MMGCQFIRLAAGQEGDAGNGTGDGGFQHLNRALGHFFRACLRFAVLAGHHHVGLQHNAFEIDAGIIEIIEHGFQHPVGDLMAAGGIMGGDRAIHQHFRLHDRHNACLLAECCIAGERL